MNDRENIEGINNLNDGALQDETVIVYVDENAKNGQEKCPLCGSTDIALNINSGKLRCNFCRHEFEPETVDQQATDLSNLEGRCVGAGAQNIEADSEDIITLKCESCGAEVVIDTGEAAQARCHWCRNTLSINKQIPNGSIPDVVLPFKLKKVEAQSEIEKFASKRKFFAHPKFKAEFTTDNIMGVYFPYMLVDFNGHAHFNGEGEHKTREYTVKVGDDEETRYDADLYKVDRDFDITIKALSIESSEDKLDKRSKEKTTNIINSIMPFDTENCVNWDANYLRGFTSERRDTDIEQLDPIVKAQAQDIAQFKINDTLKTYDRGVRWDTKALDVRGEQWKAAYLPVWLYSYQQKKGDKSLLHYIAVNARTKETMGSIPLHMPRLILISAIIEIIGIILMIFINWGDDSEKYKWALLLPGVLYYAAIVARYRNADARHSYEEETEAEVMNLVKQDDFIKALTNLSNERMKGANNYDLAGEMALTAGESSSKHQIADFLKEQNGSSGIEVATKLVDKLKK